MLLPKVFIDTDNSKAVRTTHDLIHKTIFTEKVVVDRQSYRTLDKNKLLLSQHFVEHSLPICPTEHSN